MEKAEKTSENSLYSDRSITYDERPKVHRRIIRKKLSYYEPLYEPGTIYNAEVHQSAQRLLKVHRITKFVKFCNCCALPQETPGAVVPFNCCDNKLDFGLGIYLYFYYIQFCIVMSFICIGLSSISTIIFSQDYASDIKNYCETVINNGTHLENPYDNFNNFLELCYKYVDIDEKVIEKYGVDVDDVIKSDWINKMSTYNIKFYYDIFRYGAFVSQYDNIESITLNFSLIYFITGITIILLNYIFILHINLLDLKENFDVTTPSDYALLIHDVPKPLNEEEIINSELIKIINEVSIYVPNINSYLYQIIPCLRIDELYQLAKKKYEYKKLLYILDNFEFQKELNRDDNNNKKNGLKYYEKFLIFNKGIKQINHQDIKEKYEQYNKKLDEIQLDLNKNPNKYNKGTFLVIFSTMSMRDKFYDFFPHNIIEKSYWKIKYFFENYIFKNCTNDSKKKLTNLKIEIDVKKAGEPFEIEWEKMGFTRTKIFMRKLWSSLGSLFLIALTFLIIVLINWGQRIISEDQKDFWNYVLSLSVSIIIAIMNYIAKFLLKKLTLIEINETTTDFYRSYSLKLTVFNFVTTAIIPVVSNFINANKWGDSDVLVNNLLMIFIMNILFPPVLFYFGPDLIFKLFQRAKARFDLKDVKFEKGMYTQEELNEIFENPDMNIISKYSYISNAILIPLFFMSIFPIGMIFGFAGLCFAFISEFIYVGFYKRPEFLNSKLCKFFIFNFKWGVFIFALGNYIFLSPLSKSHRLNWSLINLIVFFVIALIPYETIKVKTIDISESEIKSDNYSDNYIFFSTDYEKLYPFTRKKAYTDYFNELLEKKIINRVYGTRIVKNIQNKNEMAEFIKTKKHLDYYRASQQLNNIYWRDKKNTKLRYIFGDEKDEEKIKSLTFSRIKNFILPSSKIDEYVDYESIRKIGIKLSSFYTTTAGITNALIFLDERRKIMNNLDNYNYNPWKADWIFTKEYKMKRSDMIKEIRKEMDYKGEVSDDEDSIIKYDETQDQFNDLVRQFNRRSIAMEAKPNAINEEKPMIDNKELISGKVDYDSDIDEDENSNQVINNLAINTHLDNKEEKNNALNMKKKNDLNNMINVEININNKDEILNNNINNENNNTDINNTMSHYMNVYSQNNLMEEPSLFPKKEVQNGFINKT